MNFYRKTAIIVGALFIIATVTAILSGIFLGSILDDSGYFAEVSANENQVILAVLCELILAVSVIGIGVLMFPILKKYIEGLALGYAGIRLIESVFIIIASISLLSLLTLSQDYVAGALDISYYQSSGALLLAIRDWSHVFGTLIFLGLGGLPLYYVLYHSKLVPQWLSGWGLIGAILVFMMGVLGLFGHDTNGIPVNLLALPIAVQEMVFAVWLIVKGFNPSAIAFESSKK